MTRIQRERETHARNSETACPVEALAREHARLAHFIGHEDLNSTDPDLSRAEARLHGIEQAAPFLQASSPGAALFQTMLVKGLVETMAADLTEKGLHLPPADLFSIYSALYSIGAELERLSGEDRSVFSGDYALSAQSDPRSVAARLPLSSEA